jgi:ABC-type lipoprotein export system ATPase subunit
VAIARALVKKPSITLADEPTGNLDTHTGTHILDLLVDQCRQTQTTLIMVSHAMITCQYAKRILQMEDGVVMEDRSCEASGP